MAGEEVLNTMGLGAFMGLIAGMFVVFLIIFIALYVYSALALMNIAKRTKTENEWLAWIPIGNLVLMAKIAKMHWWPALLLVGVFIPVLNLLLIWPIIIVLMVFYIIWLWKICEARNKPGWWAILTLIPIVGGIWMLILLGILAWGE